MDDIGEEELSKVQNEASNACLPDPKELGLHGMRSPTYLLTYIGYFVYPLHHRHVVCLLPNDPSMLVSYVKHLADDLHVHS